MADVPSAANKLIKRLRTVFKLAMQYEYIGTNPALLLDFYPTKEIHAWTSDERTQFSNFWESGTKERLAMFLHFYTGQRRSDVAKMMWSDMGERSISVVQIKTGTKISIPLHPALAFELRQHAHGNVSGAILKSAHGKAFSVEGYGNWFRKACQKADLPKRCSSHGLRKAAAVAMAEAGCTAKEIMSVTGHKSLADVELYTRATDQKTLSNSAMIKWTNLGLDNYSNEILSNSNDNVEISYTYGECGGPGRTRTYNQAVMSRWL